MNTTTIKPAPIAPAPRPGTNYRAPGSRLPLAANWTEVEERRDRTVAEQAAKTARHAEVERPRREVAKM